MGEGQKCENCGREITPTNQHRTCSFYWLSDVVTTQIGESVFEYELKPVSEGVKGKDRCSGWGCDACMVEFQGRYFHPQCPKIPKRKLEI